jgi:hypothetical protein
MCIILWHLCLRWAFTRPFNPAPRYGLHRKNTNSSRDRYRRKRHTHCKCQLCSQLRLPRFARSGKDASLIFPFSFAVRMPSSIHFSLS